MKKELSLAAVVDTPPEVAPTTATPDDGGVAAALADKTWIAKADPKSGKTYYYNPATKKTTWDLKKELSSVAVAVDKPPAVSAPTPAPAAAPTATPSDDGGVAAALAAKTWIAKPDPKTGKTYYYNPSTKKTTWDLKKELAAAT